MARLGGSKTLWGVAALAGGIAGVLILRSLKEPSEPGEGHPGPTQRQRLFTLGDPELVGGSSMVASVTGRDGGELFALDYPETHITPTLGPGVPHTFEWLVGNDGVIEGQARASLSVIGPGLVAEGPLTAVPPGRGVSTEFGVTPPVEVRVSWTHNLPSGTYTAVLHVLDVTPGALATDLTEQHLFTFSVPAAPVAQRQHLFTLGPPTLV